MRIGVQSCRAHNRGIVREADVYPLRGPYRPHQTHAGHHGAFACILPRKQAQTLPRGRPDTRVWVSMVDIHYTRPYTI